MLEAGYHEFIFNEKEEWNNRCHVFTTTCFTGTPTDTGEGELKWFEIEKIPLNEMWDDDKYWTKEMLHGQFENLRFFFNKEGKYLKHEKIN